MSEHDEQAALFEWAELQGNSIQELKMLYAIPNGGHRHKAVAAKIKAEGVKAGYPDIGLDVARGGFHGLRIEMKWGKNTLTTEQDWWLKQLQEQGYRTAVCYSFYEAQRVIMDYLALKPAWYMPSVEWERMGRE